MNAPRSKTKLPSPCKPAGRGGLNRLLGSVPAWPGCTRVALSAQLRRDADATMSNTRPLGSRPGSQTPLPGRAQAARASGAARGGSCGASSLVRNLFTCSGDVGAEALSRAAVCGLRWPVGAKLTWGWRRRRCLRPSARTREGTAFCAERDRPRAGAATLVGLEVRLSVWIAVSREMRAVGAGRQDNVT